MGNIRVVIVSLLLILSMQLSILVNPSSDELKNESKQYADSEPVYLTTASDSYHVYAQGITSYNGGWVVAGDMNRTVTFGSKSLQANSPYDLPQYNIRPDLFVAYVNDLGQWEWASQPNALQGVALYRCITASDDGGIIVGGTMIGNLTFGSTTLIGDFSTDSFIAKLDGNGNWVWATQFDTVSESGAVSVSGLDLTPTGDVIVTGGHSGTTDFDGTTVTSTDDDVYLAKLSSSTGAITFVKNAGGIGQEVSTDVKVDSNGNIWQLGYVYDAFTVDGITFDSIGVVDTFLAKYNSAGTATMVTGVKSGSDSDLVASFSLAIDGQDNLYFSGYFSGSINAQGISLTSSGGNDMHVIKVVNTGALDWGLSGGKASTDDSIEKITVSDGGTVFATGNFAGSLTLGTQTVTSSGNDDVFVASITNSGSWGWTESFGGNSYETSFGIDYQSNGNIAIAGAFAEQVTKGSQTISSVNGIDLFVWEIDPSRNLDTDLDTVLDKNDNCPFVSNVNQENWDRDEQGDACDYDDDNDGITDNDGDDCPRGGAFNWTSDSNSDHDYDGCQDNHPEDVDDDNDDILDINDACPFTSFPPLRQWWISTYGTDNDGDGCRDADEDLNDDNDAFDDSNDNCRLVPGNSSTYGNNGCPDFDGDEIADTIDDCPLEKGYSTIQLIGCIDVDGDGVPDELEPENFANDPTQWSDIDGDGYGDNATGNLPDACKYTFGNSSFDRLGCIDSDGDGWSDPDENYSISQGADANDTDPSQWHDEDGDGFGDNWRNSSWTDRDPTWPGSFLPGAQYQDACPLRDGTSYQQGIYGCTDSDGDGWANFMDDFPADSKYYLDSDGDGEPDEIDDCPTRKGNSSITKVGCLDSDGDGIPDPMQSINFDFNEGADHFPFDSTEWSDFDGDNFGDNSDACPEDYGKSTYIGYLGCPDEMVPNTEMPFNIISGQSENQEDGMIGLLVLVLLIAMFLIIIGSLFMPSKKSRALSDALNQPSVGYGQPMHSMPVLMPNMNTYSQDPPPPASVNGQMRIDGQEWLEYPASSGRHYVRDMYSRQWIRKI